MVASLSVILNVLGEKNSDLRCSYIHTEAMQRLFSIFLFMTKLLQRGWETCFSRPLTTVFSTLILVLCAKAVNALWSE